MKLIRLCLHNSRVACITILFTLYLSINKLLRPYVYLNFPETIIAFILGILPNFIGAAMVFLVYLKLNISKLKSIIFTMAIVLFMEFERFYNQNINFDIFDILASVFGILIFITWTTTF
ncbi:membrane hypothetical protein [Tenacibaculum xiamenense]